jgi:cytochrome c-type protein NapB
MRSRGIASLMLPAVVLLSALSCGTMRPPAAAPPAPVGAPETPGAVPGIPDDEIGLDKSDVKETSTPAPTRLDDSAPGERPLVPRAFEGEPPRISHGIEDFLPITADENLCVTCHEVEEKLEGEATPIPSSHYTDLRNAPEVVGEQIVGARWVCTSCHVAQTGAQPLVGNRFGG